MRVDARAVEPSVVGIGRQVRVEQLRESVEHQLGVGQIAVHVEREHLRRAKLIVREERPAHGRDAHFLAIALDPESLADDALRARQVRLLCLEIVVRPDQGARRRVDEIDHELRAGERPRLVDQPVGARVGSVGEDHQLWRLGTEQRPAAQLSNHRGGVVGRELRGGLQNDREVHGAEQGNGQPTCRLARHFRPVDRDPFVKLLQPLVRAVRYQRVISLRGEPKRPIACQLIHQRVRLTQRGDGCIGTDRQRDHPIGGLELGCRRRWEGQERERNGTEDGSIQRVHSSPSVGARVGAAQL